MDKLFNIGKKIAYFLNVIVPNITFSIICITFMLTIRSRYVLKAPISWSYEISILAYMWTMFFGVGKAMEQDEHVVFGLLYDSVSEKTQYIFKILYNFMLILLLSIALIPSCQSLLAKSMVTGVLKIPYTIAFLPCIYMFIEIVVRCIIDVVKNIKLFRTYNLERGEE